MSKFNIEALVAKVENLVYGEGESAQKNNTVDTAKENSIFKKLTRNTNKAVAEGLLTQDDVKNIFGFEPSENATNMMAKAQRRTALMTSSGNEPDATIVINNNINITINVSVQVQQIIDDLISGEDLDKLAEKLINAMGKNEKAMEEFLVGIINKYADELGLDLSEINSRLKALQEAMEKHGKQIQNMEESITNLLKQQIELLKAMGFDLDALVEGVGDNNEKLGEIYEAIIALTNNFEGAWGDVKGQLNEVIAQLKAGNISLDEVVGLLKAIKTDTEEGKELLVKTIENDDKNTKLILDAIGKLNGDIATAIFNLQKDTDVKFDDLMAKLNEILEAIKDHDVHVTVDVTGKVTCECNCGNCDKPNEGIIGELNNVLNARAFRFSGGDVTGVNNITSEQNDKKSVRKIVENGRIVIVNDKGEKFDTAGRRIE